MAQTVKDTTVEIESLLKTAERRKGGAMTMFSFHFHAPVTIVMPPESKGVAQGMLSLVPKD